MTPFVELISLSYQIVKNLFAIILAFFLAILTFSCIQSLGDTVKTNKSFVYYFKENLNIRELSTIKEKKGFERKENRVVEVDVLKLENVVVNSEIFSQKPVDELKIKLKNIKNIQKSDQLSELNKLRDDLLAMKLTFPEKDYHYFENEIQKNIYWTQKFMTLQDLGLDINDELEPSQIEVEKTTKKRKKKKVLM